MRGVLVKKVVGATRHEYEKQRKELLNPHCGCRRGVTNKAKKRPCDNENDCENGLRLENEIDNGGKRFSFFTDPLKIEMISRPTMAHLLLPRPTKPTLRQNQKSHFSFPQNSL